MKSADNQTKTVIVGDSKCQKDTVFSGYSHVVTEEFSQTMVFESIMNYYIQEFLNGYNVNFMAYGQTGSGKTYTMIGGETYAQRGLIPRAISSYCPPHSFNFVYYIPKSNL